MDGRKAADKRFAPGGQPHVHPPPVSPGPHPPHLARRGQHIAREYSVDVFELMRVGDVMDRSPPLVFADTTVAALSARIVRGDPAVAHRQGTIIVNAAGRLAGIITRGDIMDALQRDPGGSATVLETAGPEVVTTCPDETLHDAIAKMLKHDIGRLPVVAQAEPDRVVGYLGRADILAARTSRHAEEEVREKAPLLGRAKGGRRPGGRP